MIRPAIVALTLLFIQGSINAGEPSGEELVAVCRTALSQNMTGLEAAMCEWYANPCLCNIKDPAALQSAQWCIPDTTEPEEVVRTVTEALASHPDRNQPATIMVPPILSSVYPCPK